MGHSSLTRFRIALASSVPTRLSAFAFVAESVALRGTVTRRVSECSRKPVAMRGPRPGVLGSGINFLSLNPRVLR